MATVPLLLRGPWFFQVDDTYAQKSLPTVNQAGLKSEQLSKKEVEKKSFSNRSKWSQILLL